MGGQYFMFHTKVGTCNSMVEKDRENIKTFQKSGRKIINAGLVDSRNKGVF